jgi:septal ring factor EnvC (AmiA/AmiB activator)
MEKDYKELAEFLGEKFDKVDQRFDKVDQRFDKVDQRFDKIEKDISEFKNDMYNFQDKVLLDLESLKQEKVVSDAQEKRKTKVLEIHNNALKSNKILSSQQSAEIDRLRAF